MKLYEIILKLKRQEQGICSNPILSHFDLDKCKEIDNLRLTDNFIEQQTKNLIDLVKNLGIDFNDKYKRGFDLYNELVIFIDLKKRFKTERVLENTEKTPDFRIQFESFDNIKRDIFIELKTLSFTEGNTHYKKAQESSLKAQIDIEQQIKRGNKIAFGVSEVSGFPSKSDFYSSKDAIEVGINKISQNLKQGGVNHNFAAFLRRFFHYN
jgi:hypothetical protein